MRAADVALLGIPGVVQFNIVLFIVSNKACRQDEVLDNACTV